MHSERRVDKKKKAKQNDKQNNNTLIIYENQDKQTKKMR